MSEETKQTPIERWNADRDTMSVGYTIQCKSCLGWQTITFNPVNDAGKDCTCNYCHVWIYKVPKA